MLKACISLLAHISYFNRLLMRCTDDTARSPPIVFFCFLIGEHESTGYALRKPIGL